MTTTTTSPDQQRRETLRWAFRLSLGAAIAPLAACGGGSSSPESTRDTLPEPQVFTSQGGNLNFELNAEYASQVLTIAGAQKPAFPSCEARKNMLQ